MLTEAISARESSHSLQSVPLPIRGFHRSDHGGQGLRDLQRGALQSLIPYYVVDTQRLLILRIGPH